MSNKVRSIEFVTEVELEARKAALKAAGFAQSGNTEQPADFDALTDLQVTIMSDTVESHVTAERLAGKMRRAGFAAHTVKVEMHAIKTNKGFWLLRVREDGTKMTLESAVFWVRLTESAAKTLVKHGKRVATAESIMGDTAKYAPNSAAARRTNGEKTYKIDNTHKNGFEVTPTPELQKTVYAQLMSVKDRWVKGVRSVTTIEKS